MTTCATIGVCKFIAFAQRFQLKIIHKNVMFQHRIVNKVAACTHEHNTPNANMNTAVDSTFFRLCSSNDLLIATLLRLAQRIGYPPNANRISKTLNRRHFDLGHFDAIGITSFRLVLASWVPSPN
jgi:hypothetical protein